MQGPNVIYYWVGTLGRGEWRKVQGYDQTLSELAALIRGMGHPVFLGDEDEGPPRCPPKAGDFPIHVHG